MSRNSPKNISVLSTSLPIPAHTHLPYDFLNISAQFIPSSMYHSLNQQSQTKFLIAPNLLHLQLKEKENLNMKSLKSLTPKLTTADVANSCTMYIGQLMKVPMKKLHGYQPQSVITHKNSLQTSTLAIPETWTPYNLNHSTFKTPIQIHYTKTKSIIYKT